MLESSPRDENEFLISLCSIFPLSGSFPTNIHGPPINIHKKHRKTIKWVYHGRHCFLCSASPRFLFRLTIECTREYKKLDIIWSKSGCNKNIIEWMAMKISEKCKISPRLNVHLRYGYKLYVISVYSVLNNVIS